MLLYEGRWIEASKKIAELLHKPLIETFTYTHTILALGRLRVRLGDPRVVSEAPPGVEAVLDEALALSIKADAIERISFAHAARAEMAWLAGDNPLAIEEARAVYDVAVSKEHP